MTNDPDIRFASSLARLRVPPAGARPPARRDARGAGDPVDRRAHGDRRSWRSAPKTDDAARAEATRPETDGAPRLIEVAERPTREGARRAALLLVRLEDAARRLVLRVRELRQHQRLLVGMHAVRSGRANGPGARPVGVRTEGCGGGRGGGWWGCITSSSRCPPARRRRPARFYGTVLGLARGPEAAARSRRPGGVWFAARRPRGAPGRGGARSRPRRQGPPGLPRARHRERCASGSRRPGTGSPTRCSSRASTASTCATRSATAWS